MDNLKAYIIPVKGLKEGIRRFDYQIASTFFDLFEDSSIKKGKLSIKLLFDKRPNMIVMDFEVKGTIGSECDRCLEAIDLPLEGIQQLMVKFSEEEREEEDDIIYIHPESSHFNVAKYIYELIHLSQPLRSVKPECDEFPEDCPTNYMNDLAEEFEEDSEEEEEDDPDSGSIWNELNKFKK